MTAAPEPVGRLIVCPTPIGNLEDVTLRVLAALSRADVLACEDTRHTRVLLDRYRLAVPLVSLHEHNERARSRELVERMRAGAVVALVSDAGTPLLSDPGFALVRSCLAAEVPVEVLPGPSAITTALVASGLPAGRWCFVGFLPRRRAELEDLLAHTSQTLVAFESPRRLAATLRLIAARDPERPMAVCRELTKLHEEVARGRAVELAERYCARPAKGEVVVVLGGVAPAEARREEALAALRELIAAGARARPAAATVAKLTGARANELYRELMRRD
jgi:16S rRNA (cytidine1402-2'-O)-methyltransferase